MMEEQRLRSALEQVLFALQHYEHWKPSMRDALVHDIEHALAGGEAPEEPEPPREEVACDPLYGKRVDSADMGEN